jgi:peroxiredoxin
MEAFSGRSLVAVVLLSLAMNIALSFKVHSLRSELMASQTLAAGTKLARLSVQDGTDKRVILHFDQGVRPTIIYVFSPSCGWCAKNLSNIRRLYAMRHTDYDFIGVSLTTEGLSEYLKEAGLEMPIYSLPSDTDLHNYHFGGTPETIVIGADGIVEESWEGAYGGQNYAEIRRFFRLEDGSITPIG